MEGLGDMLFDMATRIAPPDECQPARSGSLGLPRCPRTPTRLGPYETLAELTRRSGDQFELISVEGDRLERQP
jgi:hypothetical protein